MGCLETIKLIAEVITSFATAIVVIMHFFDFAFKRCFSLKVFFKTTLPVFFNGHTDITGKKTRFFKGLKLHRERITAIKEAVSQKLEGKTENVLVLDKKALLDIISNSGIFQTIPERK